MANIFRDLPETIDHPEIVNFQNLCAEICGDAPVSFESLWSNPKFYPFWRDCIIMRWDEQRQDFRILFWGTDIANGYGRDLSGKYLEDDTRKGSESKFRPLHLESFREQKKIYVGGTMDWVDKEYANWSMLIQPLSRKGKVSETLAFVGFG